MTASVIRIMGVDPGSSCTGYGVVSATTEFRYVTSGVIRPGGKTDRYVRLDEIFRGVERVITEFEPTHFAIEDVFYSKNPKSALVLGEARGVAILAAARAGLPIFEYPARAVKQSVTGNGAAHKDQVSFMLCRILGLRTAPAMSDESDALAIAMCHAFKCHHGTLV